MITHTYLCSTLFQYALKKVSIARLGTNYQHEATMLCQLNHSNVLAYKTCFREGDTFYLVMEYCPQGDLRNEIERRIQGRQQFRETDIVNWSIQLCHALQVDILHSVFFLQQPCPDRTDDITSFYIICFIFVYKPVVLCVCLCHYNSKHTS